MRCGFGKAELSSNLLGGDGRVRRAGLQARTGLRSEHKYDTWLCQYHAIPPRRRGGTRFSRDDSATNGLPAGEGGVGSGQQ